MINVYDIGTDNYAGNGDAVLTPTEAKIRSIAGGNYELNLVHPIDAEGKWAHLQPNAVIKAPVPAETITNAYTGMEADVYVTTTAAAMRTQPSEPQTITYGSWSSGATYSPGSKVTYEGHNYQCTQFDQSSGYIMVPPNNSPWWTEIARMTTGAPILVNLKPGAQLYYVSGPSSGWYYMSTTYGLEGYVKGSQLEYSRHLTPEETQPREVTTQLFRIRSVTVNTKEMKITATAQHVSYDLNGVLMDNVKIVRKPPAQAIAWIENAFMIDYPGTIATDMVENANADYSCDLSGKNGMFALLDPDKGVVPTFDAEFRRDNWDLFVMNKTNTDRGFRIRYGNNMIGVNWRISADNLVTRIVPVAKAKKGDDLYLSGTKWVDSQYVNLYPVIRMERLKVNGQVGKDDGTETATNWTEDTLRAEMRKQAQARYSVDKCDQLQHEITVDFERLGDTAEYAQFRNLQRVLLYDTVIVEDDRIDLSATVTVTELEYDCLKEKITSLKLTNVNAYHVKNVSGFNVLNNSIGGDKLTDDAGNGIVEQAVDESAEYAEEVAADALSQSKTYTEDYVGSSHGYSTFEEYIKWWVDNH